MSRVSVNELGVGVGLGELFWCSVRVKDSGYGIMTWVSVRVRVKVRVRVRVRVWVRIRVRVRDRHPFPVRSGESDVCMPCMYVPYSLYPIFFA